MATDAVNQGLFDQISAYLGNAELGGLFSITDGKPGGWLWDQITSGVDNQSALQIALESTDQFKARYGIIGEIRQQAAQGKAVHVPSVADVREYEQKVTSLMRQAGLPNYMYDNWSDTHDLMRNGLSAVEVEQRLGQAWDRVHNTDPSVRDAFSSFYGTLQGDAALAATFLDPSRTMAALEKQSRAAYTAGMGSRLGINIDQQLAERVAALPKSDSGIMQDLTQLNTLDKSGIMSETMGESAKDLTTQTTGVDSVMFGDGSASSDIERRIIERQSARTAGAGGAVHDRRGLSGAGTASDL